MKTLIAFSLTMIASCAAGIGEVRADVAIGFHAPTTGFAAADGKSALIAAQLAVDDINASGGMAGETVKLVPYDDQGQATQAITIANKLVTQDHVAAVVSGSYSEPTRAAATVFQAASVPYIAAYATHPGITAAGDDVFRSFKLGPPQGVAAANFIASTLKLKTVSVIAVDNDYGQTALSGFKPAAEKDHLQILDTYTFGMKDRQFGSIVASVKHDHPDAVYVAGYFFQGAPLAIQLHAAGVDVPIIGTQGFDSQELIAIAGAAANGIYIVNGLNRDNPDPKFKAFVATLKARGGVESISVASAVYSALMLLDDAARRAKSVDPAKLRDALQETRNFPHFYGTLKSFDAGREADMEIPIIQVQGGVFKFVADAQD